MNLCRDIAHIGVYWTKIKYKSMASMNSKQIKNALLTQIKFHKRVLKSKGDKEIF
jgi:hypothetical protein